MLKVQIVKIENLSLLLPVWNTNMSQFTDRSGSKRLTLFKDRQEQIKWIKFINSNPLRTKNNMMNRENDFNPAHT